MTLLPSGASSLVSLRSAPPASPDGPTAHSARLSPPTASDVANSSGALVVSWRAPSRNAGVVASTNDPSSAPRPRRSPLPA